MTAKEIVNEIRRLLGKHRGTERDLYEALCSEAEGWNERLTELENEDKEQGDEGEE